MDVGGGWTSDRKESCAVPRVEVADNSWYGERVTPVPPASDLYGDRDPRNLPRYSLAEASRLILVPRATLRSWSLGRRYPAGGVARFSRPVLLLPSPDRPVLSFTNLVEAHILASIRKVHGVSLERVRTALDYVERVIPGDHPMASGRFSTDGVDLFIHEMGQLINASQNGQIAMRASMDRFLRRVEVDDSALAVRLFPWIRPDSEARRTVVVDPRVSFGRPVVAGTGVPTAVLHERWLGGDSVADLALDYGLDAGLVEDALRCEDCAAA